MKGLKIVPGISAGQLSRLCEWLQAMRSRLADCDVPADFTSFQATWSRLKLALIGSWTVTIDGQTVGFFYSVVRCEGVALLAAVFEPSRWATPVVQKSAELVLGKIFANDQISAVSTTVLDDDTEFIELCCDLGAEPSSGTVEVVRGGEVVPAIVFMLFRGSFYDKRFDSPSIVRVVPDVAVEDLKVAIAGVPDRGDLAAEAAGMLEWAKAPGRSILGLYAGPQIIAALCLEGRPPSTIAIGFMLPDPTAPLLGEGLQQAIDGVFRSTPTSKIQLNAPEGDPGIGLMKMLGGHLEGVFRDGATRGGQIVDLHSVAIYRQEFMREQLAN